MAAIKKVPQFAFDGPRDTRVTVGHNRAVELRTSEGKYRGEPARIHTLTCYLHGHAVASFERTEYHDGGEWVCDPRALLVTLADCDYRTPTTRQAMVDFCGAVGAKVSVSFAQRSPGVRYRAVDCAFRDMIWPSNQDAIEFSAGV